MASVFIGAPLVNREVWSVFTRNFERGMKVDCGNGASIFVESLRGEPGERASLLRTLNDTLSKALKTGVFSVGVPFGEHGRDSPLPGTSRYK